MSELMKQIKEERTQAMRDKDKKKLGTLRLLISEIENEMKVDGSTEIKDEQVQTVVSRQLKKLGKEKETYQSLGKDTESQDYEIALLITYLPSQLNQEQIEKEVQYAIELTEKNEIKNPMQYLSKELKGKADMGMVMKTVKDMSKKQGYIPYFLFTFIVINGKMVEIKQQGE